MSGPTYNHSRGDGYENPCDVCVEAIRKGFGLEAALAALARRRRWERDEEESGARARE